MLLDSGPAAVVAFVSSSKGVATAFKHIMGLIDGRRRVYIFIRHLAARVSDGHVRIHEG